MGKIVYLAHYSTPGKERDTSPAGTTVMEYVIECLEKLGKETVVISSARSQKELPREEVQISSKTKLILAASSKKTAPFRYLKRFLRHKKYQKAILQELLRQVEDGDTLLVYHSLSLMKLVQKIKEKRNITLVLQVCEIYADVLENRRIKAKELSYFSLADKYIFQTEILNHIVNTKSLPYAVLHGAYKSVPEGISHAFPFASSKIRCVYAGTLDPRKGGAFAAVATAAFLPENFHIHILGFGTENEIEQIQKKVEEISRTSKASVSYDGCLRGEEYLDFIKHCHIGLSTQNPDAAFNMTSFPSKILVYMASGLRVVTVRIPAVESSLVGRDLFYYELPTPQNVAQAIQKIDFSEHYDGKQKIESLNESFCKSLEALLKKENI